METTHLLLQRTARLEQALQRILKASENYHPDSYPLDLLKAIEAAREALND